MATAYLALSACEREQFYSFSEEVVIGRGAGADLGRVVRIGSKADRGWVRGTE